MLAWCALQAEAVHLLSSLGLFSLGCSAAAGGAERSCARLVSQQLSQAEAPSATVISDWSSAALPVLLGPPGLGFSHVDVADKAHADQDAAKDDEDQHPGHLLVILQLEVHQLASLLERLRLAAENPVRPRARWSEKAAPAKLCRSHALVHRPREAVLAAEHAQRLQLLERERVGGDAVRDVLELLEQPLLRPGSSVEHSYR